MGLFSNIEIFVRVFGSNITICHPVDGAVLFRSCALWQFYWLDIFASQIIHCDFHPRCHPFICAGVQEFPPLLCCLSRSSFLFWARNNILGKILENLFLASNVWRRAFFLLRGAGNIDKRVVKLTWSKLYWTLVEQCPQHKRKVAERYPLTNLPRIAELFLFSSKTLNSFVTCCVYVLERLNQYANH